RTLRSIALRLLVGTRFQVLFHSAPAVLFTFPSRYYALSVASRYLALEGGPPSFPRGSSGPAVLRVLPTARPPFRLQGCHLLWPAFPDRSTKAVSPCAGSAAPTGNPCNPLTATPAGFYTARVWAPPLSLAATWGISVDFFSSGY